jgi:hypothetical protein
MEWENVNKKCGVLKAAPLSSDIRRMKEKEERTTQVRHQYSGVRTVYSSVLSIIIVVLCCVADYVSVISQNKKMILQNVTHSYCYELRELFQVSIIMLILISIQIFNIPPILFPISIINSIF